MVKLTSEKSDSLISGTLSTNNVKAFYLQQMDRHITSSSVQLRFLFGELTVSRGFVCHWLPKMEQKRLLSNPAESAGHNSKTLSLSHYTLTFTKLSTSHEKLS